jgi:CheY-like chemotaxis protein
MRARELVDQILTFSRQAGSEKVPVDLAHVVDDALRFLRSTLPTTIGIEVDIPQDCEPVLADATQIYQVILNLGSNAAHAMRTTGGTMRLTARPASGAAEPGRAATPLGSRRFIRIEFSDSGHGMGEETRKRIFDPFFTTKDVGQGTGLGLSVVHGIIEAHQGMISVASQTGKGTTFTIHLPVAEGTVERGIDGEGEAPRGNGERIAIVDDEDIVRSFSQMALERIGYRIESFDKPADCLEAIRARPGDFSMLLTDQTMPGMRGIDLAMEIRALLPELPVIIMSGYFSRIAPETLAKLGYVELLSKPFTNEEPARRTGR